MRLQSYGSVAIEASQSAPGFLPNSTQQLASGKFSPAFPSVLVSLDSSNGITNVSAVWRRQPPSGPGARGALPNVTGQR